jgi:undecaprenyl diphosphate synthase
MAAAQAQPGGPDRFAHIAALRLAHVRSVHITRRALRCAQSGSGATHVDSCQQTLPRHVAIVMDGNGRWARQRRRPRSFGHRAGQKTVRSTIESCLRRGISALTLFAFSRENWQRPQTEVSALMQLFLKALDREVEELHGYGVRIRFIGELSAFAPPLRESMHKAMERTQANGKLALNIAVNYGGRWDIAQAAQQAVQAVERGELSAAAINENSLARFFCLADLAPVDLFIRTGGERRISNFLLWQLAYSELHFSDVLWPDYDEACFARALEDFSSRERRYGKTSAQITAPLGST